MDATTADRVSAAPVRAPAGRRRWALAAGFALVLAGFALWSLLAAGLADLPQMPYRYQVVAEGEAASFRELDLEDTPALPVRKLELMADGVEQAVAVGYAATMPGRAPVLLGWENRTAEPTLAFDTRATDVTALARAVARHAPAGATVLSWWDTSRQLGLLAGMTPVNDTNLAQPLLLPAQWRRVRSVIESAEEQFWQAARGSEAAARFERYVDALVSEESDGLAALRALAGSGETYLIVQIVDAYRAGMLRPDRLGIGYRDFPRSAGLHGTIATVKAWLREQGHESYTIDARDPAVLRVFFLTTPESKKTLIARLLPFSTSNPFTLDAPRIVHQQGPYWVFRLSAQPRPEGSAPAAS